MALIPTWTDMPIYCIDAINAVRSKWLRNEAESKPDTVVLSFCH